jgi:hypothetical protein
MKANAGKWNARYTFFAIVLGLTLCTGCPCFLGWLLGETETKVEDHRKKETQEEFADDRIEDKKPTPFDPDLVDRRPFGDWRINSSAAVIRLKMPPIKKEAEAPVIVLHPSYAAASAAAPRDLKLDILPSVNMVDGKAKQFDDGMYAALDQAYYKGLDGRLLSHVQLVHRFYDKAGRDNPAGPYLAAALELAGVTVEPSDAGAKKELLKKFRANEVASKPIGFYTWNDTLSNCFRFLRFLQVPLESQAPVARALAGILAQDAELARAYDKMLAFYAHLTNPPALPSLATLNKQNAGTTELVAFLPSSTSRETELFNRLFGSGLPLGGDFMRELIRRIRSGEVDLKPRANSGWYDHQVYALETLLLPGRGEESDKLVLAKEYKKRMLDAFRALLTKRRETHVRMLNIGCGDVSKFPPGTDLKNLTPRLRVEPCPTYFVRTARAYAFVANFLEASIGKDALQSLHGLTQSGSRKQDLYTELHAMRDLFYGLYLVSAEDIGMKPTFLSGEPVDREACYRRAVDWLRGAFEDPDISADTRVLAPIFVDPNRGVTRVWATLGVRLAKLDADYAEPPSVRRAESAKWQRAAPAELGTARYLIPVDEFAEVELSGFSTLTREEFRALCDKESDKESIIAALQRHGQSSWTRNGWLVGGLALTAVVLAAVLIWISRRKRPVI